VSAGPDLYDAWGWWLESEPDEHGIDAVTVGGMTVVLVVGAGPRCFNVGMHVHPISEYSFSICQHLRPEVNFKQLPQIAQKSAWTTELIRGRAYRVYIKSNHRFAK